KVASGLGPMSATIPLRQARQLWAAGFAILLGAGTGAAETKAAATKPAAETKAAATKPADKKPTGAASFVAKKPPASTQVSKTVAERGGVNPCDTADP